MRKTNKVKTLITLMMTLVLLLALPVYALAESSGSETGSITVSYPLENTEFRLYKVADSDGSGGFTMVDALSEYDYDFSNLSQDEISAVAEQLSTTVLYENVEQTDSQETKFGENITFENLTNGVYLIIGSTCVAENKTYTPVPALLSLPQWEIDESGKKTAVWDVLVSDKYTVVDNASKARTISNESDETADRTDTTDTSDTVITPSNVDVSDNSQTAASSTTLPRTGQYWWQVSALAGAGLIVLLLGLLRRKRAE